MERQDGRKRKRLHDGKKGCASHGTDDTEPPPPQPPECSKGRLYTVSIAVASSILVNIQSPELRTYIVGEIARAAAVFHVDEIVVYGDPSAKSERSSFDPTALFARLLQYVETHQYLRKALFPHHPDLRFAGLLNPLDAPHHPRAHERLPYREGVTLERRPSGEDRGHKDTGCLVDVGLPKPIRIDRSVKPGVRVTVRLDSKQLSHSGAPCNGVAVSPSTPREALGTYWGYITRVAPDLSNVFAGCPFKAGSYDLTIGTSERGTSSIEDPEFALATFKHVLIVFGGVAGLEACVEASESLPVPSEETSKLFDVWLNVCPHQGSRTIRTEEAIVITLARLRSHIVASGLSAMKGE